MASRSRRLIRDAVEVVLRRLLALSPSPEVEALRAKAEDYLREAEVWSKSPPTVEARERLMKSVLKLHVAVAELEREVAGD